MQPLEQYQAGQSQQMKDRVISDNFNTLSSALTQPTVSILANSISSTAQTISSHPARIKAFDCTFTSNGGIVLIQGGIICVCGSNNVTLTLYLDGVKVAYSYGSGTGTFPINYVAQMTAGQHSAWIVADFSATSVTIGSNSVPSGLYVLEVLSA